MWEHLRRWWLDIPYADALERRQAMLIQLIELGKLVVVLVLLPLPLLAASSQLGRTLIAGLMGLMAVAALLALGLVRRGRLGAGVLLSALSVTTVLSVIIYSNTLASGAVTLFAFAVPLTMAGVVAGRRALLTVLAASLLGVSVAMILAQLGAPGAGFAASSGDPTVATLISFILVAGLLAFVIDGLSALAREALEGRRARERELEAMSRRLEGAVRERTADLEIALGALEQRAAAQADLIKENERQRVTIHGLSVPVLPLGGRTVLLPLVGELDDARLAMVSEQALGAVERLASRRLLIDITGVPVIDTYVAQSLMRTLYAARLLGAEVALVGVRPEVAQAIVGLGIDLGSMAAFADLQSALG